MTRKYSSISVETTLASGISNSATAITVAAGTGSALLGGVTLAAGNVDQFTLAIDPDTNNEEIVFATAVSSDTFTITRGRAGSSAVTHAAGATVKHVLTSDDLSWFESNTTPVASWGVRGSSSGSTTLVANAIASGTLTLPSATDTLVGRSTTDTLTNKTLSSAVLTGSLTAGGGTGTSGQVLTSGGSSVSWTTPVPVNFLVNAQTGTTYTPVAGDNNKLVTLDNANAITVTLPAGVFSVGSTINFVQLGVGQVTFQGDVNFTSTVNFTPGNKTRVQYSVVSALVIATNTFLLVGDLAA